tara:strand:+ start:468 stop:812 length:345 start_codon:yes stop_codon:yes gene_type:complete
MDIYLNNIIKNISKTQLDKDYINNQFNGIYKIIDEDKEQYLSLRTSIPSQIIDLLITIFKGKLNSKPILTDIINVEVIDVSNGIINNDIDKLDSFLDQQTEIIMQLLLDLRNNI